MALSKLNGKTCVSATPSGLLRMHSKVTLCNRRHAELDVQVWSASRRVCDLSEWDLNGKQFYVVWFMFWVFITLCRAVISRVMQSGMSIHQGSVLQLKGLMWSLFESMRQTSVTLAQMHDVLLVLVPLWHMHPTRPDSPLLTCTLLGRAFISNVHPLQMIMKSANYFLRLFYKR